MSESDPLGYFDHQTSELANPFSDGVLVWPRFFTIHHARQIAREIDGVSWKDTHDTFINARDVTIVQNHFTYAHKLSAGDQSPLTEMPRTKTLVDRIGRFVRSLAVNYPNLGDWQADEFAVHKYDEDLGLSYHKDNHRFMGVVAIASLEGLCDLAIKQQRKTTLYHTVPGNLILLRAPGLTDDTDDLRPEHAVVNVSTPTRTSLMVRANTLPDDAIPGFTFNNWP